MTSTMHATCGLLLVSLCLMAPVSAQDYTVERLAEPAPQDDLSEEIQAALATSGYRVANDSGRSIWEFWPAKQWQVEADFTPTPVRMYAFQPGTLIGVVRLPRRGADFRDQTISRGTYTVRYALQPVDGNHVGTSPTQDFLLMMRAEDDATFAAVETDAMLEASAAAAESSHPAMLCLQKLDEATDAPSIQHREDRDWWVVRLPNPGLEQHASPAIDIVVVGHADE